MGLHWWTKQTRFPEAYILVSKNKLNWGGGWVSKNDCEEKDPLEKQMATRSSILAWEILATEEPGGPQSMEFQRAGHDLVTEH